jgi:hypothetical protein
MKQSLEHHSFSHGGTTQATGLLIAWQRGLMDAVLEEGQAEPTYLPNGATVETVIQAAIDRLKFFQGDQFACRQNAIAITKLEEALHWLEARTAERKERGVENSYQP